MVSTGQQCQAVTRKGQPCQGYAVNGSRFCFSHDPESARERQQARRRGGKARHGRQIGTTGANGEAVSLASPAEVLLYLEATASDLAKLENSVSRAQAAVKIASAAINILTATELEQRLAALEAALQQRGAL